jgi:hypothetical protein
MAWRGLARDVLMWARECLICQKGKVHCRMWLRPQHVTMPTQRFSHIHVDLVGPLPASEGATYVLTVIDKHTRWFQTLPLSDISAKSCAAVLVQGWILCASSHYLRKRQPVHLGPLGQPLQHHGHQSRADHPQLEDTHVPAWPASHVSHTCPGYCLAYRLPHARRTTSLPLRLFLAHPLFCLVNFLMKIQTKMNLSYKKN